MNVKKTILLFIVTFAFFTICNAQTTEIKTKDIYKEIDVKRHNDAFKILDEDNKELKQQTVEIVLKNPNYYNPSVIYALSRELYNQDKKDEAVYWLYVAQLRVRYDANLCMDKSVNQIVSILNREYSPNINKYGFQNLDKIEKTVKKAVDFVRMNEENYDHRWINLLGMDVMLEGTEGKSGKKEITRPNEEWSEIKEKTINDYYNVFIEYVKNKKK